MTNSTLDPAVATPRQLGLRVDESRMTTAYANAIRTTTTLDEVVLDFGMSLPQSGAGRQPTQVLTVDARVVVNWANAKRLALSLSQMVQAYEQQNGEIALALPTSAPANR